MPKTKITLFSVLIAVIFISGCSSTAQVQIDSQFPTVVSKPKPVKAAIVFTEDFKRYIASPNSKTSIDLGSAQTELLSNAFAGLFNEIEFVSAVSDVTFENALVITPSVQEVQVSTPSDTYLNVYEVWIKYSLDIETVSGDQVDSWFMPAYGKTPDSFMLSKTNAIEEAAIIALRDAGAKLLLDFYRIPSVYNWLVTEQISENNRNRSSLSE
ncbi:hypothetical protein N9161_08220 [Porticoccaceae bacterium]|jgi:hypothetical protein|nr:hypothetical protein [Porticoccaceae bacterium]MDB4428196.1 hypothetical protein [Porticoccaceae bacterium]MDC0588907.1 hypothetical protein [Porticoccaceae bacterium]MDG1080667.1 hypothetical protein [Porticoccaceae bacterium]